jgi:hypothetical protein
MPAVDGVVILNFAPSAPVIESVSCTPIRRSYGMSAGSSDREWDGAISLYLVADSAVETIVGIRLF